MHAGKPVGSPVKLVELKNCVSKEVVAGAPDSFGVFKYYTV